MDGAIKEFEKHLKSHPRTILSARFGDGKSFFLSAAEKKLKNRFVFLKVYPVNYQVAENQDIFEYIKRDLLFQLYSQGMVPESYEVPDSIAAFFFLQNNWEQFAEEVLKMLSLFDASNTIKATLGATRFLNSMKKKYEKFKNNGGDIGARIDHFLSSFDDKGIYEADPITSILCNIIRNWKNEHSRRKICFVFEDMDRIDPSHIFRILNVISAHMDYGYKYGVSPSSRSLAGNKFGVDNIVVCLDYDNLRRIFHHFYGQKACFDGYINKFCDRGVFRYSLQEQVKEYYVKELVRATEMKEDAVKLIFEQFDFSSYTLRQLCHALEDVDSQITIPKITDDNHEPPKGMFILSAILRRLGVSEDEIKTLLSGLLLSHPLVIGRYLVECMMRKGKNMFGRFEFSFGEKDEYGNIVSYSMEGYINEGEPAYLLKQKRGSFDYPATAYIQPLEEIEYILSFVSK